MSQLSLSALQDRDFAPPYGETCTLSPLVARLLAPNPGPFTFRGTGVHLVGAGATVAVIDPGPLLEGHMAALRRAIGRRKISHILITHTHRDHSESANALKAWSGAQTYGFGPHISGPLRPSLAPGRKAPQKSNWRASALPATATSPSSATREGEDASSTGEEADDTDFAPDVRLKDGEAIRGEGFTLTALHTPGHASNHLCFALEEERALFTGDHVMGWSSSVIAPPDGDMAAYLASLRRLIARADAVLYPTHGAPISRPADYMQALLQHRLEREAQIRACLARGVHDVEALVDAIYAGLDPALRPAAALTIQAHLNNLNSE